VNYRHATHVLNDWSDGPTPQPVAKPTYGPEILPENPPVTPTVN
jgi:outer membrane protein